MAVILSEMDKAFIGEIRERGDHGITCMTSPGMKNKVCMGADPRQMTAMSVQNMDEVLNKICGVKI